MKKSKKFGLLVSHLLFYGLISINVHGQEIKRTYRTARIAEFNTPIIDGSLNDSIWQDSTINWSTNFVQRLPNENQLPSAQTAFKIWYDTKYLYVGVKCADQSSALINRRMSRRDGYNGDWVEIIIDSYHDLRSAVSFGLSAAGVKSDKYISLNGVEEDIAWNPIWYANSSIDKEGWYAEMKIPLSQLRFGNSRNQVWGLQVQRRILRNEELSVWQRVPQDAPGWVSEFGQIEGISNIKPQRQIEIQPFVVSSVKTIAKDQENPFRNSNQLQNNMGVDGKIGLTNDFTIDFTINPDFGQVEADPAAIALDGFQLFFQEQRPFFIENKNIFDYRFSTPKIGSIYSSDNLFYSRRIGRKPQGALSPSLKEFSREPSQTTILGAVKLSGKTKNGLSVGIMESLTSSEYGEIDNGQTRKKYLLEPQTNYFVTRVQKDLNNRNTFIGGILTSVVRSNNAQTNFLHQSAHTGGIDLFHQWDNRNWYAGVNLIMSHVSGSKESILQTQQSIPHLFQRMDVSHVKIDSTKTFLLGSGGDLKFGKAGNGNIQFESGITWRSPQLELNDIGFMREADLIQHYFGLTYRSITSFKGFRSASIGYKHWFNWDFAGNLNYIDWDIELNATFQNNWSGTFGFFSQPHIYSKSLLQGGPRLFLSDQYGFWWGANSDTRKKLYFTYNGWTKTGGVLGATFCLKIALGIVYQPVNQVRLSFTPKYTLIRHRLQYNQTVDFQYQPRYVVSSLDQNTLSLAIRADLVINANMGLQYFGEPFISMGTYNDFGYVANPLQSVEAGQIQYLGDQINGEDYWSSQAIDENFDGITDYQIQNPDFSFAQFRSNLVYRWEYRPGSEFYLVWSQGLIDNGSPSRSLFRGLREQLFNQKLENTFLIKMTYRFHR